MTGSIINDLRYQLRYGNMVVKLMFICIGVFLVLGFTYLGLFIFQRTDLFSAVLGWISLPASFTDILYKPWTLITFMFTHYTVGHILGNMLWLYLFGNIFLVLMPKGEKSLLGLFVGGSLVGALFAICFIYIIPPLRAGIGSPMVGASAGVMALTFATATISPHYKINLILIGEVSIVYIALASFVIDLLVIPYGNAGGMLAHIGGSLFGYGYIRLKQTTGKDFFSPFYNIIPFIKSLGRHRLKVTHKVDNNIKPKTTSQNDQDKVDAILDKMNRSGYESLSKEEKEFLFHFSNKK